VGKSAPLILGAILLVAGGGGYYAWHQHDTRLTRACETVLAKRLRSPSSYQRIEVTKGDQALTPQEFKVLRIDEIDAPRNAAYRDVNTRTLDQQMAELASSKIAPMKFVRFISYDAANGYGALVRSTAECDYLSADASLSHISEYDVRVDGKTEFEDLDARVRASQ